MRSSSIKLAFTVGICLPETDAELLLCPIDWLDDDAAPPPFTTGSGLATAVPPVGMFIMFTADVL